MRLRSLDPQRDRTALEDLWRAALAPAWPPLPAGLDLVREGIVADEDRRMLGAAAVDPAGSILLLLVHPQHQRRGIGTALLDAAMDRLRAAGASRVGLGSGAPGYVWPGVPANLPGAVRFFEARGCTWDYTAIDLTCDLHAYGAAATSDATLAVAGSSDAADALAFERRWFPQWVRWFEVGDRSIMLARGRDGDVAGTLLFAGPGRCSVFWPMLGDDMATIGCVGVAEPARHAGIATAMVVRASRLLREAGAGACHIGWAWRTELYERAGYRPWREYLVAARVGE
jgi:GNAT superfamily N-acetyltransferase